MNHELWMIFYITYGVAVLLLLGLLIRGLVKRHSMRRVLKDMGRPLRLIILSLIVWYATTYIAKDFADRF